MRMHRRMSAPMFLGQPSPSLAKMRKMSSADLATRIQNLQLEADRLIAKVAKLKERDPQPKDQIAFLLEQAKRLEALQEAARERMVAKDQRRQQWQQQRGSRGFH